MRRLFTNEDARAAGITTSALRWGVRSGQWRPAVHGVYAEGPEPVSAVDAARAQLLASRSAARGQLAGVLHDLDGITLGTSRSRLPALVPSAVVIIEGVPCADAVQTLVDLAAVVDDDVWEQALECVLRRKLATIADLDARLVDLVRTRAPGTARIRRVLDRRPRCVPPTGSLLETLFVQLARGIEGLPDPVRQLRIENRHGDLVAFVDLSWPDLGLFIELDGQQHKDQPVYDARRETAVVAATGWLVGRYTWTEVVHLPSTTARRLAEVVWQARRRPVAS